jgi:hypothetical protein
VTVTGDRAIDDTIVGPDLPPGSVRERIDLERE